MQEKVNNYLNQIIQKRIQLVPVTSKEWPELRQDYIKQMNKPNTPGGNDQDTTEDTPQEVAEDEVVTKAVELFGENIVEVID